MWTIKSVLVANEAVEFITNATSATLPTVWSLELDPVIIAINWIIALAALSAVSC